MCAVVSFNPGSGNGLPSRNPPRDPSGPLANKGIGAHAFNHLCRKHVPAMPCWGGAEPNLGLLGWDPRVLQLCPENHGASTAHNITKALGRGDLHPSQPSAALVAARGGAWLNSTRKSALDVLELHPLVHRLRMQYASSNNLRGSRDLL